MRNAVDNAATAEQKNAAKKMVKEAQAKDQQRRDMADFKQKTLDNLASIKEMFAKAEDSWKNTKYHEAGALYSSVSMATVPGSEQMVETSRGRMVELEDLAKSHLKNADDADLKRDYIKQVEELSLINREFKATKTREVALRRLVNLKSRPEVSGYVEYAQAEGLESDGKLMEAITSYNSIATNPRYENSVAALKAKRKLDELHTNDETREKIKTENDAKADREAPVLLASAKNFVSNNLPKQAIEKLQQVIDKYPNSRYAEDAKKQISELK
jgi:TolA-binding protein